MCADTVTVITEPAVPPQGAEPAVPEPAVPEPAVPPQGAEAPTITEVTRAAGDVADAAARVAQAAAGSAGTVHESVLARIDTFAERVESVIAGRFNDLDTKLAGMATLFENRIITETDEIEDAPEDVIETIVPEPEPEPEVPAPDNSARRKRARFF